MGGFGGRDRGGKGGDIGMEGQAIIASGHQVKGWTWKGKGIFFSPNPMKNKKMSCYSLILLTGSNNRLWVI